MRSRREYLLRSATIPFDRLINKHYVVSLTYTIIISTNTLYVHDNVMHNVTQ